MFKAYDNDGNGVLSPEEIYKLIKATYVAKGEVGTWIWTNKLDYCSREAYGTC